MFSRLDFRRPLSPVFDFARDGSDSRTAAGYRAYSLGQNYMEKQSAWKQAIAVLNKIRFAFTSC